MKFRSHLYKIEDFLAELQRFFWGRWRLCLVILVYIIIFSAIMIFKQNAFLTSGFDLGIFNQAFWTTSFESKLFYSTADLSFNPGGSFFGVHFSPILFLLLPFYAICPRVETLLVLQSTIIALGAIPLYRIARENLNRNVALHISILYLVYPALNYLNLNDFHLEAFLPTFFLFAVYYLEREKWPHFLVFVILSMATIEFTQIIVMFVALYGLLLYRRGKFVDSRKAIRIIFSTFLLSVLCFILALKVKDFFNPYTSPIPTPFHTLISDPISALYMIFNSWNLKVFYIIGLLAPLAFLPLLALEPLVMAIPWIGASFITDYLPYYSIYFHYNGFIIPFVFIALVKAIKRLTVKDLKLMKKASYIMFLATIIFTLYLPFAQTSPWMYQVPTPTEETMLLHEVLSLIPPNASVLTQNEIFPHVSGRSGAYMYMPESSHVSVDYMLVNIASYWYSWEQPDIFGDRPPPSEIVPWAIKSGEYGLVAVAKSILLLKKGYVSEPVIFVPYATTFDYQVLKTDSGQVIDDATSVSGKVLFHDKEDPKGVFWSSPNINLPPGQYKASFTLKIGSEANSSDEVLKIYVRTARHLITEKSVYGAQAHSEGEWFNVTLTFGSSNILEDVEFLGAMYYNHEVFFDFIALEQLSVNQPSLE